MPWYLELFIVIIVLLLVAKFISFLIDAELESREFQRRNRRC